MPEEELVGTITQYDDTSGLALIILNETLAVGEHVHVLGPRDDFHQPVEGLRLASNGVQIAYKGDLVWMPMLLPVESQDKVFAEI